jgi:hypothetical protein
MTDINQNVISNTDNKVKLESLNKNLNSSLNDLQPAVRKDKFGISISKILKKHKISFADQVENSNKLVEIKLVTSYREHNKQLNERENNYSCGIF